MLTITLVLTFIGAFIIVFFTAGLSLENTSPGVILSNKEASIENNTIRISVDARNIKNEEQEVILIATVIVSGDEIKEKKEVTILPGTSKEIEFVLRFDEGTVNSWSVTMERDFNKNR